MEFSRINIDPEICGGKPIIRGMRIRVSDVLDMLSAGMTEKEILNDFPYLEKKDIKECLKYASRLSSHQKIELSKSS
jgi:uncharacterized protein (DUF433 family)